MAIELRIMSLPLQRLLLVLFCVLSELCRVASRGVDQCFESCLSTSCAGFCTVQHLLLCANCLGHDRWPPILFLRCSRTVLHFFRSDRGSQRFL